MDIEIIGRGWSQGSLPYLVEEHTEHCEEVLAAIAYASSDNMVLLRACDAKMKPLRFYGRYDLTIPVQPEFVRWFLDKATPRLIFRAVPDLLHAKIIWWVGRGVYVGSANMTDRAWYKNIEAGVFVSQAELVQSGQIAYLERMFADIHQASQPISVEFYRHLVQLREKRKALDKLNQELERTNRPFFVAPDLAADGLSDRGPAFLEFQKNWRESLQYLRDIQKRLETGDYDPPWIPEGTPLGAHVDQFIHAYYYKVVRGDQGKHLVAAAHKANRSDPERALQEALVWWSEAEFEFDEEFSMLKTRAPKLREAFAKDRIMQLSKDEFLDAFSNVHALIQVARYRNNAALGLPDGQTLEIKVAAHVTALWNTRSAGGKSILDMLNYVLWELSGSVEWRIWRASRDPLWRFEKVAEATLGELVGWVRPDEYPPRNGRTLKGLFALGYPIPDLAHLDVLEQNG